MLHLDCTVVTDEILQEQSERILGLGGRVLYDRFNDPDETLRVYAHPCGHPICVFVV